MDLPTDRPAAGPIRDLAADVARCLRFYSRLPVPALPWEGDPHAVPDFRTVPRALPLAGALIGAVGAAALLGGLALGFGPWLAAALCVAALTLATGGLHEDGLADTADGFWGGRTPERRLEIMKDSRIGSHGGVALVLAFSLRILALGTLAGRVDPATGAAAVVWLGALSRSAALMPMAWLGPARSTGASHAVGRPTGRTLTAAGALCLAVGAAAVLAGGLSVSALAASLAAALAAALAVTRASERMIGGMTGDVIGAAQQACEIAALLGLLMMMRP